ncbi:MAG: DNA adenine methylase [Oscillospiraceae bacterium]|nr:DNA adenine methylase [Oscillospiraceae bacterium]
MNPLIKWPGGKANEIGRIIDYIPSYNRYIEPFFGGGALFFYLKPNKALINDVSSSLIEFYNLIKQQDKTLFDLLLCYNNSFSNILSVCNDNYTEIFRIYQSLKNKITDEADLSSEIVKLTKNLSDKINYGFTEKLLLDEDEFLSHINKMIVDKMIRTIKNDAKTPFNNDDLKENLITGFTSGYYMYFRKVFNDLNLKKAEAPGIAYKVANFYFIREYCYGSMFRYNSKGEFNIPYGGMSYNRKNFRNKIESMFNADVKSIFKNTDIHCSDFEEFFKSAELTNRDFMFLDPPYDTDFSDYEGTDFTKHDQERLAHSLKKTMAQFILIIKNTDFIESLYKQSFNILSFDNQYTYNVRSRNERNVKHLIITNIPV